MISTRIASVERDDACAGTWILDFMIHAGDGNDDVSYVAVSLHQGHKCFQKQAPANCGKPK